jgi:hypothetical protein
MPDKTPMEMFSELVQMGHIVPASIEPSSLMAPTAYVSVPTTLVFATPPKLPVLGAEKKVTANAKLAARPRRNSKRIKRHK